MNIHIIFLLAVSSFCVSSGVSTLSMENPSTEMLLEHLPTEISLEGPSIEVMDLDNGK